MLAIAPDARLKLAAYLEFQRELGIECVRIRPDFAAAETLPPPGHPQETLPEIQADVGCDCRRCKLAGLGRHTIVFGSGNPHAELVFVGEGPGADEDAQGLPFVGRGGQLLTDMIQKGMGLRREQVYICNVVKCRPPGNRTPEADEIAVCSPFLRRQLRGIAPRMVCALGATAAQALRPYRGALASVRGRIHKLMLEDFETRLVITYHPAFLLRDPSQKREAWKDLQLIMEYLCLKKS
ncbi:MAG: uracil-DNA glycosylase [Terriglobales bacterium]